MGKRFFSLVFFFSCGGLHARVFLMQCHLHGDNPKPDAPPSAPLQEIPAGRPSAGSFERCDCCIARLGCAQYLVIEVGGVWRCSTERFQDHLRRSPISSGTISRPRLCSQRLRTSRYKVSFRESELMNHSFLSRCLPIHQN